MLASRYFYSVSVVQAHSIRHISGPPSHSHPLSSCRIPLRFASTSKKSNISTKSTSKATIKVATHTNTNKPTKIHPIPPTKATKYTESTKTTKPTKTNIDPRTNIQTQNKISDEQTSTQDQQTTSQTPNNQPRVAHAVAPDLYPIIALVGRPNVGKSTLFNRFALGDKRALIGDVAGTTRDRDYASCRWYGRELIVVDTGGIVGEGGDKFEDPNSPEKKQLSLAAMVRAQAMIAINEASTVVFVMDIHDGVTQHDLIIARMLRKRGKHVVVVVNKADNQNLRDFQFQENKAEYERLGFGAPVVTSAIHGEGFLDILDRVVERYPETPEEDRNSKEIRIAIVGQPNAGKSSLLNRITGEPRSVVSPIAGTTSDPVDTLITWRGSHCVRLIDTAGIWKRAKDALARAAVIWALRVVQRAHVVILVIDGTVGVTEHDKHVAGFILEHMKSVVVAVNKWDIYPKLKREQVETRPKRTKLSSYEWLQDARDLAAKVMTGDKAGVAAWERGETSRTAKKSKHKDKRNKQPQPQSNDSDAVEDNEETGVEVVKVNKKPDVGKMSNLTQELLDLDKNEKGKQAKKQLQHADDEIDFEQLEESATEFNISMSDPPPPQSNEEPINRPAKKLHKSTPDELEYEQAARAQLNFLPFVPFNFISATTGYRVPSLMDLAVEVFYERGTRIKTQDMFEVLRTATLKHKLPSKGRNMLKVKFAHQIHAYPPTFVFFVNNPDVVQQHYGKFLETCIREKYKFVGTPIRIIFRKNSNKYTAKK